MSDFIALLDYYPLPLVTKHPGCEEIELLVLAHAGMTTFYQYPDPTNLIEWEQVNIMEIGAVILENTKTGKKYRADLANFGTQRSDLVLPCEEMLKAHQLLNPGDYAHQQTAPVNNYAERHTANREQLYKVAIAVLADHPDECRGAQVN